MRYKHRPPHLYLNNTHYFITSGTLYKQPYFDTPDKKELLKQVLLHATSIYEYSLNAWVILDNHYHLLIKTKVGTLLPKFISAIHGKSTIELNKMNQTPGVRRWYQYWDYCIRGEEDFWRHLNYIHHNPVKHGYIKEQDVFANYVFSSYAKWLKEKGKEWMDSCFLRYSIVDFTREEDDF